MKIRNLSKVALAIALSSGIVFQGCKKYDDDIRSLQEQIDRNSSDIAGLKTMAATNVVTNVESTATGVKITFKKPDGSTETRDITVTGQAGAPGADAPVFSIGDNGNWWVAVNGAAATDTGKKAVGTDGQDGIDGQDGEDGKDGKDGVNGADGTNGKDGADGQDGADGKDGVNGADGTNGKDGSVVTVITEAGKKYWAIDGESTGIQAYGGSVSVVPSTNGTGYTVTFTDEMGDVTDAVFIAKESRGITSLSLVPYLVDNNSSVLLFPRISGEGNKSTTLLQGGALVSYKLNPYGVGVDYYNVLGFVQQTAEDAPTFRSGSAVSSDFEVLNVQKSFGEVSLLAKKSPSFTFPDHGSGTSLYLALKVHNTEQAIGEAFTSYVTSQYHLAKEEIIYPSEVTIEKAVQSTDGKYVYNPANFQSINSTSPYFGEYATRQNLIMAFDNASNKTNADAKVAHFDLLYDGETIVLGDQLKGFFVRQTSSPQLLSMRDHGLGDYTLKYSIPAYNPTGDSQDHGSYIEFVDGDTGEIQVKKTTGDLPNTAAINKTPLVKVELLGANNTVIATRYVKIEIVDKTYPTINVNGTVNFQMQSGSQTGNAVLVDPNTLDAAYNTLQLSSAQFHATYSWDAASVAVATNANSVVAGTGANGISVIPVTNPATNNNFQVTIGNQVLPGTYTISGEYTSTASQNNPVKVEITVVVGNSLIDQLVKAGPFWNAAGNGVVNGKNIGSNNWKLYANLWDYWDVNQVSGSNKPTTTFRYDISTTQYPGFTIQNPTSPSNTEIQLDDTHTGAKNRVNNGTVTVTVTTVVNGVDYTSENFNIAFVNPVKPLVLKTAYRQMTDKENSGSNTSTFDLRRAVSVHDFNNTTIYNYDGGSWASSANVNEANLRGMYGILGINNSSILNPAGGTFTDAAFVNAYAGVISSTSGQTPISLHGGASATVSGNNAVWTNTGANLQSAITLVYRVKVHNKFNTGSLTATAGEVEQLVYIVVQPNN